MVLVFLCLAVTALTVSSAFVTWCYFRRKRSGSCGSESTTRTSNHFHSQETVGLEQRCVPLASYGHGNHRREARYDEDELCGLPADESLAVDRDAAGRVGRMLRPRPSRQKPVVHKVSAPHRLLDHSRQTQRAKEEVLVHAKRKGQSTGKKNPPFALREENEGIKTDPALGIRKEVMCLFGDDDEPTSRSRVYSVKHQCDQGTIIVEDERNRCSLNTRGCGFQAKWDCSNQVANHGTNNACTKGNLASNLDSLDETQKTLDSYTTDLSVNGRSVETVEEETNLDVQNELIQEVAAGSRFQNNASCLKDDILCGLGVTSFCLNDTEETTKSHGEKTNTPESNRFLSELDHLVDDLPEGTEIQGTGSDGSDQETSKFHSQDMVVNKHKAFDDFDFLSACSSPRLSSSTVLRRRNIRPVDRQSPSVNPVKNLRSRKDVQSDLPTNSSFHPSAVAGLQTKVDFSQLKLRKTVKRSDGSAVCVAGSKEEELINMSKPALTLVQVKGRRHVQVRVVEPSEASLCSDDCYLLITSTQLWIWIGKKSNIIEKARVQDLAGRVLKCHEFGCNAASVQKIEEKINYENGRRQAMLTLLHSGSSLETEGVSKGRLPDEEYERLCLSETKVYDVSECELVLNHDIGGKQLSYSKLYSDKVAVYDFGSEVYVWSGKNTTSSKRQRAIQLSQTLCASNKLFPSWGLLCPVTEGHEPLLFREKFPDWPEPGRIIKAKGHISSGEVVEHSPPELFPVPPDCFVPAQRTNPDFCAIERINIGRGRGHGDYTVETLDLTVWLIHENTYTELPQWCHGEFCSQEAYVIRWGYRLSHSTNGINSMAHKGSGSYRCCYFFWQGEHCSVTEKTASALLTVELDKEQGPQIRVVQHKEPPVFLQLFNGDMVVYHERSLFERAAANDHHTVMFTVRSCIENELYILQVPDVKAAWLQSVSSFIIVSYEVRCLFVWHGSESADSVCEAAVKCASSLRERLSARCECELDIITVEDGKEEQVFWDVLMDQHSAYSPVATVLHIEHGMRLFQLSSVTGRFEPTEVLVPFHKPGYSTPFPFLQCDLYSVPQPALFMLLTSTAVILWMGKSNNDTNRSRWLRDRKLALQTARDFAAHHNMELSAFVVKAGHEPEAFQRLFPFWEKTVSTQNGVTDALCTVEEEISKLSRQYTLDELQTRPVPDGVDVCRLETYLSDEEFAIGMGMDRDKFNKLPHWRQVELKQSAGLF